MEGTNDDCNRQLKRQREESTVDVENCESVSVNKRQKSYYNDILSVLEEEEDENEPEQNLSSLITTLQHEISSSSSSDDHHFDDDHAQLNGAVANSCSEMPNPSSSAAVEINSEEWEISESEKVVRRLLEASDDELGLVSIPNNDTRETEEEERRIIDQQQQPAVFDFENDFNSGDLLIMPLEYAADGLWEIEDEAANYYTLLQSELFM